MNRLFAIALLVAALGLIVFSVLGNDAGAAALQAASSEPLYNAPRGLVSTDRLPLSVPGIQERHYDKRHRPYHLLVRVLGFDDLQPVDVKPELLVVPGAHEVKQIDTGVFLVENLDLGLLTVSLLDDDPDTPRPPSGGPVYAAARNPVSLARHAITECELILIEEEDVIPVQQARGLVLDRFTGEGLAGVHVVHPNGASVVTDDEGRFEFEEEFPIGGLFALRFLLEGYIPIGVSTLSLSRTWVEHLHDTGEAIFTLRPESR